MHHHVTIIAGHNKSFSRAIQRLVQGKIETTVFRSFGGYSNSEVVRLLLDRLKADIGNASKYHDSFYYTAGYDSPIKFLNRHNEVWLLATN